MSFYRSLSWVIFSFKKNSFAFKGSHLCDNDCEWKIKRNQCFGTRELLREEYFTVWLVKWIQDCVSNAKGVEEFLICSVSLLDTIKDNGRKRKIHRGPRYRNYDPEMYDLQSFPPNLRHGQWAGIFLLLKFWILSKG